MGGGGFMQHASDTNRKDRNQKSSRREKFNGTHSEKASLAKERSKSLDFSHLNQEEIDSERQKIHLQSKKRRKQNIVIVLLLLSMALLFFVWIFSLFS